MYYIKCYKIYNKFNKLHCKPKVNYNIMILYKLRYKLDYKLDDYSKYV